MNNLWLVIAASVLGTYMWRAGGMLIASRLHADSPLSRWFTCVAYAVLAGFIARMLVVAEGSLAEVGLMDKLLPLLAGFVVLMVTKRNVEAGTAAAFAVFVTIALWRGHGMS